MKCEPTEFNSFVFIICLFTYFEIDSNTVLAPGSLSLKMTVLLVFLPLPSEDWGSRYVPSSLVYVTGDQTQGLL